MFPAKSIRYLSQCEVRLCGEFGPFPGITLSKKRGKQPIVHFVTRPQRRHTTEQRRAGKREIADQIKHAVPYEFVWHAHSSDHFAADNRGCGIEACSTQNRHT